MSDLEKLSKYVDIVVVLLPMTLFKRQKKRLLTVYLVCIFSILLIFQTMVPFQKPTNGDLFYITIKKQEEKWVLGSNR